VNFRFAEFKEQANFPSVIFNQEAEFREARFHEANFRSTTFAAKASFSYTEFNATADFTSANFGAEAYFSEATFIAQAYFSHAKFGYYIRFDKQVFTSKSLLDLQFARIDNPNNFSFTQWNFGLIGLPTSMRAGSVSLMYGGLAQSMTRLQHYEREGSQTLTTSLLYHVDNSQ